MNFQIELTKDNLYVGKNLWYRPDGYISNRFLKGEIGRSVRCVTIHFGWYKLYYDLYITIFYI